MLLPSICLYRDVRLRILTYSACVRSLRSGYTHIHGYIHDTCVGYVLPHTHPIHPRYMIIAILSRYTATHYEYMHHPFLLPSPCQGCGPRCLLRFWWPMLLSRPAFSAECLCTYWLCSGLPLYWALTSVCCPLPRVCVSFLSMFVAGSKIQYKRSHSHVFTTSSLVLLQCTGQPAPLKHDGGGGLLHCSVRRGAPCACGLGHCFLKKA